MYIFLNLPFLFLLLKWNARKIANQVITYRQPGVFQYPLENMIPLKGWENSMETVIPSREHWTSRLVMRGMLVTTCRCVTSTWKSSWAEHTWNVIPICYISLELLLPKVFYCLNVNYFGNKVYWIPSMFYVLYRDYLQSKTREINLVVWLS